VDEFLHILTQPDNMPIAAMLVAVFFLLGVWLRQALRNDRLLRERREDEIAREMRR
jgi:hypothetical protein